MATRSVRGSHEIQSSGAGFEPFWLCQPCTPHQHSPLTGAQSVSLAVRNRVTTNASGTLALQSSAPVINSKGRQENVETWFIFKVNVVTTAFGPTLHLDRIDYSDPVIGIQFAAREFSDHLKNLIRESADVE